MAGVDGLGFYAAVGSVWGGFGVVVAVAGGVWGGAYPEGEE